MAEAVVAIVSRRLGEFTIQEAKFLYGVSEQVRLAQTELRLMQGFLKDADVRQREEGLVRIWVTEIRDAAYDLEDVIESFILKVACKRRGAGFKYVLRRFACVLKEGVYLYKIGSKITSITTKISNLRLSAQTYNIREIRDTGDGTSLQLFQTQQQLGRTYSHVIGRDIVGLEDDVKELIVHLVNDENCHRVVSIWGMGGLGKTTLAQQVYHHKQVRSHFDCSAWMCISQRCNIREVWEGILVKLNSPTNEQREEIAKMKDDEIARKLYHVQKEGRCLVVLDDIWSIRTLNSLKAAFPLNEESRSRILLTTRNREVALHPDRSVLHQPGPLNDDVSWELFEKSAIIGRDRTLSTFLKIKSCYLHDLVRDMCLLKAEEENFLEVVSLYINEGMHPISSAMETKAKRIDKVRRLAVHVEENVDLTLISKEEMDDSIRSLLYFSPMDWKPKSKKLIRSLFKDFKLLRVLQVEWISREVDLPKEIGNMIHLRYFSLRYSHIKMLPNSVANLTCLQTLDFRAFFTFKIPNVVGKMKQLRHLYFPLLDFQSTGKQKLSSLGNLQTLHISSDDFDWTDLTKLTNLRKLAILVLSPLKNMEETLKSATSTFKRLQSLTVSNGLGIDRCDEVTKLVSSCHRIYKLNVSVSIVELPKDPQYFPNLTRLNLWRCDFKDDQMAILEKLPNLTIFIFHDMTFEENRKALVCSKGGFLRLEVLSVGNNNLDEWKVEEGAMPNLCTIHIYHWTQLRRVPEGLRYITTLKELKITGMRRTDCARLEEGGEDFYIIRHVPSLIFEETYNCEEEIPTP